MNCDSPRAGGFERVKLGADESAEHHSVSHGYFIADGWSVHNCQLISD
jgi:hypothetical protein